MTEQHSGRWLLAGYGGLVGFFAVEAAVRARGNAASLDASESDRGTTNGIVRACLLAAALPPVLRRVRTRPLPPAARPIGLALQASGLALRVSSMRTLGAYYSRTLRTQDEQRVVDAGAYRLVRHPGYLGSLLMWTGFALTSRSVPVVVGVAGLLVPAYRDRIAAEEELLRRDLPGYAEYSRRTKKLIPFIW